MKIIIIIVGLIAVTHCSQYEDAITIISSLSNIAKVITKRAVEQISPAPVIETKQENGVGYTLYEVVKKLVAKRDIQETVPPPTPEEATVLTTQEADKILPKEPNQETIFPSLSQLFGNVFGNIKERVGGHNVVDRIKTNANGIISKAGVFVDASPYIKAGNNLANGILGKISETAHNIADGTGNSVIKSVVQGIFGNISPSQTTPVEQIQQTKTTDENVVSRKKRSILGGITGALTSGVTGAVGGVTSVVGGVTGGVGSVVGGTVGTVTGALGGTLGTVLGPVLGSVIGPVLGPILTQIPILGSLLPLLELIPTLLNLVFGFLPSLGSIFSIFNGLPALLTNLLAYILNISPRGILVDVLQGILTLPADILSPIVVRLIKVILYLTMPITAAYTVFGFMFLSHM